MGTADQLITALTRFPVVGGTGARGVYGDRVRASGSADSGSTATV